MHNELLIQLVADSCILEGMEKMPRKQSDLPSLYSAYEDLHNRSSASDFSPAEKTVLEEVRTRIKQAEVEELSHNPGLEKIFSVIVEHVDEVRSAVSILEEMRRYMRVLETEQETTLLHKALDDYQEKMSHLRSLQEEIEDNIQLFTQKQGKAGGLFLTVSEFIEPIQPLFIDQYDKDEVFRGLIQVPEVASDQTLPPRPADQNLTVTIKRPQLPRATGTAASTLHNRLAPYATAYDLLRKSNAPRANVVAAWNDKKNAFERFMNEITARQDIEPDQRAQRLGELLHRGRGVHQDRPAAFAHFLEHRVVAQAGRHHDAGQFVFIPMNVCQRTDRHGDRCQAHRTPPTT